MIKQFEGYNITAEQLEGETPDYVLYGYYHEAESVKIEIPVYASNTKIDVIGIYEHITGTTYTE